MDKDTVKMAAAALADPTSIARDVATRLGITTTTLYGYVNGDGSLKEPGFNLLNDGNKGAPEGSNMER